MSRLTETFDYTYCYFRLQLPLPRRFSTEMIRETKNSTVVGKINKFINKERNKEITKQVYRNVV